jgi:Flp pilus assembly protein TadD
VSGTLSPGSALGKSAVIAPLRQGGPDSDLLAVAIAVLGGLALGLMVRQRSHAAPAREKPLAWGLPRPRLRSPAALTWRPDRLRLAPLVAELMALRLTLTGRAGGRSVVHLDAAPDALIEGVATAEPEAAAAVVEPPVEPPSGTQIAALAGERRPAGEAGLTEAETAFALAIALEREHDLDGAQKAYRRADALGHPEAAFNLGCMLAERGEFDAARWLYSRADELGHAAGACNLGVLLEHENDLAGAEAAYRRGDSRGNDVAAFNLGVLLEQRGDLAGAKTAYLHAEQRGPGEVAEEARVALLELLAHP